MGKLFDEAGVPLTPSHAVKSGRRYRYYVSKRLIDGTVAKSKGQSGWRLPAREIERIVGGATQAFLADRAALTQAIRDSGIAANRVSGLLDAAARWRNEILDLVQRVNLNSDQIAIGLNLSPLTGEPATIVRHVVPMRIKRRGEETKLVLEGNGSTTAKLDPALFKAIAHAHKWFDDLVTGRARSLREIADNGGISDRYVSCLMPLAFLAPDIVEAILAGTQPIGLTAEMLIKRTDLPPVWAEQRALLSFD